MLEFIKSLLLEFIFPTKCINCNKQGKLLCLRCYKAISIDFDNNPLKHPYVKGIFVATNLDQDIVEKAIYQFKYNFVKDLGFELSQILVDFLIDKGKKYYLLDIDCIIPVPLSKKRFLYRGFNQSEILGRHLSRKFGWELVNDVVLRRHKNKPQVDLGYKDRIKNVQGVFQVKDNKILKNKNVLIIDDVLTTGSTITELAKTLKKSGAKEIWALVLAKNK